MALYFVKFKTKVLFVQLFSCITYSQDREDEVCRKFQIKTYCFVCEWVLNFPFILAPNSSLWQSHEKGGNLNPRLLFSTNVLTAKSDTLNVLLFKAVSCCALWPRLCQSRTFKASSLCQLWVAVYMGLPWESRLWWIEWKQFWSFVTKSKKREGEENYIDLAAHGIWPEFCEIAFINQNCVWWLQARNISW